MTTVQALAVLFVRFWAVGALIGWIFNTSLSISLFVSDPVTYGYIPLWTGVFMLVFWVLILAYSRTVTSWVLPPVKAREFNFEIDAAEIIRIGTFLIGIFYLLEYLPQALGRIAGMVQPRMSGGEPALGINLDLIGLLPHLLAIMIVLALLFRPRDVARAIIWLRSAGAPQVAPDAAETEAQGSGEAGEEGRNS